MKLLLLLLWKKTKTHLVPPITFSLKQVCPGTNRCFASPSEVTTIRSLNGLEDIISALNCTCAPRERGHMKLLVNKRSLIFPMVTPTVDLGQNIIKNCSFSFCYLFVWRFMTSYLRNSKMIRLTHIFSFVLLSVAEKNSRTSAITFGKLSVF